MELPAYTNTEAVNQLDRQLNIELQILAADRWHQLSKTKMIDRYITPDGDLWMCKMGHRFRYFNRQCCPVCDSSRWERIWYVLSAKRWGVDQVQKDFIGAMELDIVVPAKEIAIEFNGAQHYSKCRFTPDLTFRQAVDAEKKRLCEEHLITLVVLKFNDVEMNMKKWTNISMTDTVIPWVHHHRKTRVSHLPREGPIMYSRD